MEGEIKVRLVDAEEKSVAEVEEQLLKQHEESTNATSETSDTVETTSVPDTVETIITEDNSPTIVDDIDDNKVLSYIGKRYNRDINNLDELCPICHKLKGQQSGDYNNTRRHGIKLPVGHKGQKRVNACNQFEALFGS